MEDPKNIYKLVIVSSNHFYTCSSRGVLKGSNHEPLLFDLQNLTNRRNIVKVLKNGANIYRNAYVVQV